MEKKINMPKLAPEMESGVLCAWLKEEGESVAAGEPLFEIETNKVVNQVEATTSGVLKKQLVEEGDTDQVFYHPRHPYTQKLIDAIPTRNRKEERHD